jgi:membrane protease YdiL (CAAX protease family)
MDTETVYFHRYGLSPSAYKFDQLAGLAEFSLFNLSMIDIFSSYRLLHSRTFGTNRVQMDKTNIPSLLLSPFKLKYLKNPWVFVPILLAGASSFFTTDADKPLSKARSIMMFDREYTPTQAALLTAGIGAYQYLLVASGEELFFRGMIQTELTEHMTPWLSIPLSSLFFGLLHLHHHGWSGFLEGTAAGLYFGYRYQKNKYDLGEVISAHFWTDWLPSFIEFIRSPRNGRFVYSINWKF